MEKIKINKEYKKCLNNMKRSTNIKEKLMWQNIYFWFVKNEDKLKTT